MQKKTYKRSSVFFSIKCALKGLAYTFYSQKNMVIHSIFGAIVLGLAFYFRIKTIEWVLLIISICMVLVTETINTAIEISIDLVTKKTKFRAMLAKDIAAGAVLLSAINALIVGYLLFFNRLGTLMGTCF
jgi:diacylglycerol kinase (ATP)